MLSKCAVIISQGELTAYTAGGAINAYQPLFITNSLTVLPASGENATHAGRIIGMSISAAATGETVYCKRSGNVTNPAWALTPGERYYIGAGGELTTSTTGMAFVQKIGIADSATVLFLQIEPPILE